MNQHRVDPPSITAHAVSFGEDTLIVRLSDDHELSVPLEWFPRLRHATAEQRQNWRLITRGIGIHWPDVDEDIAVEDLLLGRPSGESQASLRRWLAGRAE